MLIQMRRFLTRNPELLTLRHALRALRRMFLDGYRPVGLEVRLPSGGGLARSCDPVILNLQKRRRKEAEERLAVLPRQVLLCRRAAFAVRLPGAEARGRSLRSARYSCLQLVAWMRSRCPGAGQRARVAGLEQGSQG